jgi:hypothetical protein
MSYVPVFVVAQAGWEWEALLSLKAKVKEGKPIISVFTFKMYGTVQ